MESNSIENLLENASHKSLLRISTAGSVDDGKSTFIGRLLYDCKGVYEDTIEGLRGKLRPNAFEDIDLAWLTDGLRAEREQGITIDVAYRYFSTPRRHFILADTPGHEQYTRNMVTGASTANLAILLIDGRHGVTTQTRRHAFISSLLGIPRLLVAVNKMDLIDWSSSRFEEIKATFSEFAAKLSIREISFVPISALKGDNVVHRSEHMQWYTGQPIISYLEEVYIESDLNLVDFRFPVQYVIRPDQNFRGYAGQIASGSVKVGQEITILPSNQTTKISAITTYDGSFDEAHSPMCVTLSLEDDVDVSRGDMIVRDKNRPRIETEFEATLIWMAESALDRGSPYKIKLNSRTVNCRIVDIQYRLNVDSLGRESVESLTLNEIARVTISTTYPVFIDDYAKNRSTGSFILIDEVTNSTVAAGTIIDRLPKSKTTQALRSPCSPKILSQEQSLIGPAERRNRAGYTPLTVWFTGLSGAGKTTLARLVERALFDKQIQVAHLDGDNLRHGLCSDLGFSNTERSENIRRTAEVAKILNQAGVVVLASLISPHRQDRADARRIIGGDQFIEVFVDTPLEVCEHRDPKGLYKKARSGQLPAFTGISSPYEHPTNPELHISTSLLDIEAAVDVVLHRIMEHLLSHGVI